MSPKDWLPLLQDLAERADALALERFRASDLRVDEKPDRSLVTEADLAIEEMARIVVAERHPELGIFGEEHGEVVGDGLARLIIDPIDATANFARGIPVFATLLAIEEGDEVIAGLVSAPALATRWWAARGEGAYRSGQRISVSATGKLANAQIFYASLGGHEAHRTPPGAVDADTARRYEDLGVDRLVLMRGFTDMSEVGGQDVEDGLIEFLEQTARDLDLG